MTISVGLPAASNSTCAFESCALRLPQLLYISVERPPVLPPLLSPLLALISLKGEVLTSGYIDGITCAASALLVF